MITILAVGAVTPLLILSIILGWRVQALRGQLHDIHQIADVQMRLLAIKEQELDACKDALSAERRTSETLRAALRQAHDGCGAFKVDCMRVHMVYSQN
jgi:hypothetical protein